MSATLLPMTLGEIFDNTFRMIGKTILRNLAIAFTFLAAPLVLFSVAANRFYSTMAVFQTHESFQSPALWVPMFSRGLNFAFASMLFSAAVLMAEIAVSIVISGEMTSEHVGYADAIRKTFDVRWLNGIGEGILKLLIMGGAGLLAALTGTVIGLTVGKGLHVANAILIMFSVLFLVVIICFVLMLIVRLYFALTAVAVEGIGPIMSIRKSWFLVGGHWWRTLGILLIFFILSGFVTSLITTPIVFGTMWDSYRELFTALGRSGGSIGPSELRHLQMGMGKMIGIGSGLSSLFSLLITPAFTVVMYYDLKARHHDLPEETPAAAAGEPPVVTI